MSFCKIRSFTEQTKALLKKMLLLCLFIPIFTTCLSQTLPNLKHIKLRKTAQFNDAEPTVLKVVDYLFETPIDKKNKERNDAGQFLIKWMNGTSAHVFYLDEKETNYFSTDADLLLMYMAGLTKYTLEHAAIKTQKTLVTGTLKSVLPYLNKQSNKKSWSADLWQLNEAHQQGRLESFLYP